MHTEETPGVAGDSRNDIEGWEDTQYSILVEAWLVVVDAGYAGDADHTQGWRGISDGPHPLAFLCYSDGCYTAVPFLNYIM